MNLRIAIGTCAFALLVPLSVSAADVPLRYLVEEKPLKQAVAGTQLMFGLYRDDACTALLESEPVDVEDVNVLVKLKQMTPKNDTKLPNTVELRHTLSGVAPRSPVYLKVVGTGVVPVGGVCQAQSAFGSTIAAWARVTAAGTLDTNFNIASVSRVSAGQYRLTLDIPLQGGFSLIPVVTPEIDPIAPDTPPVGAANVRIPATNQSAFGTAFDVFIYNGNFALVDNDFQVIVTGR
jgi:hypothetical protein